MSFDPGHGAAVVETDHKIHVERDASLYADHNARNAGVAGGRRHKVDKRGRAFISVESGFQNKRTVVITALDATHTPGRLESPETIFSTDEVRGGKECVSTFRHGWSPYP